MIHASKSPQTAPSPFVTALKVRVRDTAALNDLLAERIGGLEGVRSTKTTIVLRTAKETSKIPIAGTDAGRPSEAGNVDR